MTCAFLPLAAAVRYGLQIPQTGGATLAAGRDPSGAISAPQAVDATTYPRTGSGAGRAARGVERWRLPHLVPLGRTSPRRLVLGAGAIDLGARPRPKLVRGYLKYGTPGRPEGRWRRASSSSSGRPWARLGRPASGSIPRSRLYTARQLPAMQHRKQLCLLGGARAFTGD